MKCNIVSKDIVLHFNGSVCLTPAGPCVPVVDLFGVAYYVGGAAHKSTSCDLPRLAWMARVVEKEEKATFTANQKD
eukprot:15086931-Alexandrium_andersonii.AAC.1